MFSGVVAVSVVTTPAGVILRIALEPASATKRLPALSNRRPRGMLNFAAVPTPSTVPGVPAVPAIVVTTPAGVTSRIVELPESPTYRLPAVSIVRPDGYKNFAAGPVASTAPLNPAVHASVVTPQPGVTLRIVKV